MTPDFEDCWTSCKVGVSPSSHQKFKMPAIISIDYLRLTNIRSMSIRMFRARVYIVRIQTHMRFCIKENTTKVMLWEMLNGSNQNSFLRQNIADIKKFSSRKVMV